MIWVDHREKRSVVPTQLEKLKVPIEFKMLEVGDYIVSGKEDLCAERKDMGDYVSSLVSGRLNNELYQMSFNYPISMIIVEGYIGEVLMHRKVKRQNYLSSLAGDITKRSPDGVGGLVNLVMLEGPLDTALFLKFLHDKETIEGELVRLPKAERIKISDEDRKLYITASLPSIGPKRAKDLLTKFGSIRSLANAEVGELTEIRGIGGTIAPMIHKVLNEKYLGEVR